MTKDLKHFGIPGMRWGIRRNRGDSGPTRRKTGFGSDGRKVNRIFGARNRKKIRQFLLGNEDEFVKSFPIVKEKYAKLTNPEDKKRFKEKSAKVLATVSILSMATIYAIYKNP